MRQAALDGTARAKELGLTTLTVDEIEQQMDESWALSRDPELALYPGALPLSGRCFFTEEHGFNVAYSHKTSDFVQAGEEWWETAWARGSYISPVEYDESAGVYLIEIALRIDGAGAKPLGVFKAVLDIHAVQKQVAEAAAHLDRTGPQPGGASGAISIVRRVKRPRF